MPKMTHDEWRDRITKKAVEAIQANPERIYLILHDYYDQAFKDYERLYCVKTEVHNGVPTKILERPEETKVTSGFFKDEEK
jgi:hypothetical protein